MLPAHQQNVPMPTLYASPEGNRKSAKPSITQLVLYNIASILASVASGFDVRTSNVSPIHPSLQPQVNLATDERDNDGEPERRIPTEYGTPQRSTFPHNTYHGPTKHVR